MSSNTTRLASVSIAASVALVLLFGSVLPTNRPVTAQPCQPEPIRDEVAARRILATKRPFAPTNRDLFFSYDLPDWTDMAPIRYAPGPGLTERGIKEELRAFLNRRFPCSPQRVLDGLAVYDNPLARNIIPDPTLRAALAALTGTLGEPAIQYLLTDGHVSTVHFGINISYREGLPKKPTATVFSQPDGTSAIVIDGRLRYNPFATFSALLFHEALHVEPAPREIGLPEEIAASSLETLVYMQMLLTDPTLAKLSDPLTRGGNNEPALARLNSGVAGTDRLNLFVPNSDVNIDPFTVEPLTNFADFYARFAQVTGDPGWRERETRGNPLLKAVLATLAEPGHEPLASPDFDRATLDFIDQNEAVLSPGELVAVACILELDIDCD